MTTELKPAPAGFFVAGGSGQVLAPPFRRWGSGIPL